ncbi:MAG: O-antigen ligase family protein [Thermogutta sp.]
MKLAQLALIMAATIGGLAITLRRLGDFCGVEFPEMIHFVIYAPAVALGALSWLVRPSPLSHWSVVLVMAIPLLGLFYGESSSFATNAVIAFYLLSGPAIGSLIVEYESWWRVARWTVLVNAFVVFLAFYLTYRNYQGSLYHTFVKFGYLPLEDQTFGANPNQMGGQLAFASVLGLVLFFRSGRPSPGGYFPLCQKTAGTETLGESRLAFGSHRDPSLLFAEQPTKAGIATTFSLGKADWFVLLAALVTTVGCFMTGSRGAVLSLFVGGFIVLAGSVGLQPLRRLRDLMVLTVLLLTASLLLTSLLGVNPILRLMERFSGEDVTTVATAGNRLLIWENVIKAWTRDPARLLVGTGTGGADIAVGELDPGATWDDSGEFRRNCHNAFLEWILSYGILGSLVGALFVTYLVLRAVQLDRAERTTLRTGLLAALFAFAVTAVSYRHLCWPVEAALVLAFLCEHGFALPAGPGLLLEDMERYDLLHRQLGQSSAKADCGGYQPLARWPIYH